MVEKLHWAIGVLSIALVLAFVVGCGGGNKNDSNTDASGGGSLADGSAGTTGGTGGVTTGGTGGVTTGGTGGVTTGGTGGVAPTGGTGGVATTGGTGGAATTGGTGGAAPDSGPAPTDAGKDAGISKACDELQTCCDALQSQMDRFTCSNIAGSGNFAGCEAFKSSYCPKDAGTTPDGGAATCAQLQDCCNRIMGKNTAPIKSLCQSIVDSNDATTCSNIYNNYSALYCP
jgi:hypothetical protein